MKKAAIILPTYNERENIVTLIPQIFSIVEEIDDWHVAIVVVDDNSPDKTADVVTDFKKEYGDLHIVLNKKEGLGKAYIRGFSYAIEKINPDVIFEMDADWSHDPKLIPIFLKEIDEGADFVIGSRYIKGGSIPQDWGLHRKILSFFGNLVVKLGFMNLKIHDWTSGYRAIKANFIKETLPKLNDYNGYVFQVALLDLAYKRGLRISEIPLNFIDRTKGHSKINSLQYSLNTILYVFANSSFIKFCTVGVVGAFVDFGLSYLFIEKYKMLIWVSTLISAEAAIVSNFILNNFWSFSHKKIENKLSSYLKNFISFNFISGGSLIIQVLSLSILTILLPLKFWYIYKVLVIVFLIIPYSYFMYNYFIWKQK